MEIYMLNITLYHVLSSLLFLVCFVAFVFITRGRRPISNILAWLFFMFLLPYIGIPLFLIFGQRKLTWVLAKKRLMYNAAHLNRHNKNKLLEPLPLESLLDTFGIIPVSRHNKIEFLDDGINAYHEIIAGIQAAEHSILISTYRIANDEVGCAIVELLTEKAKQGVQVCLLIDTIGGFLIFPRRKLKPLRKAGGSVRYIMPLFHTPFRGRANLRDHRKIIIFDGKSAIMGGMNLGHEYMGVKHSPKRWIDYNILIHGNAVNDLLTVFESDWQFAASRKEKSRYKRPPVVAEENVGTSIIQTVASGPDTIGDPLYDAVMTSLHSAKKSIYIVTPYFILDDGLQKAFMIAIRRGVDVNIIIPKQSNHPIPDLVRGLSINKLRDQGAKIWLHPKMIHAKVMVFDDTTAISCFLYSEHDIQTVRKWVTTLLPDCVEREPKRSLWYVLLEDAAQLLKPLL
jgi:cardiolipin synthase